MRNISNLSKRLSDSVLGLALIATPLSFLARPLAESDASLHEHVVTPSISQTSSLGKFLESEVATRIERVSGRHFDSATRTNRSREIASAVAEASYLYDVDPFLLLSMIEVESRYHADAVGLHGEIGLMQIKPSTARWVAPVTDALYDCDLHQIRCNIMMGANYVGHIQHKIEKRNVAAAPGLREHVLRSYNLGPAKADRLAADRTPATDDVSNAGPALVSYATKIAWRTDRMRRRYLVAALSEAPASQPTSREIKMKRAPESISTVAMIH